jgi:hypothetical protein
MFDYDAVPIEVPVAAQPKDIPCNFHSYEDALRVVTCNAQRRCHLCGEPVSVNAVTVN